LDWKRTRRREPDGKERKFLAQRKQHKVKIEAGVSCSKSPPFENITNAHLSLHPKPVVRPILPLNNLPSRCLTRLLGVSLESLGCLLPVELFLAFGRGKWDSRTFTRLIRDGNGFEVFEINGVRKELGQ
jgi:hypothetical protein